jgi:ribosomal-protein-alanine N-acetyltransferase
LRDRSELATVIDTYSSKDAATRIRFAIVDQTDGSLIGTIGLPVIEWTHRTAEVAYDLRPSSAGRGIATACCLAVSDWLLRDHGFFRVQATALDTNAASIRVLEKSGFSLEGRLANLKIVRGASRDFILYAKTKASMQVDLRPGIHES